MDIKYKKALNEVSQIIALMTEEDREKINKNFLNFVENNKSKFNEIDIVANQDLEEQNISEEAKAIIYLIVNKFLKD